MGSLLTLTKQALGLAPLAPLPLDLKLLVGTDALGRTNPLWQYTGAEPPKWLGTDNGTEQTRTGYSNHDTAYAVINYILTVAASVPWGAYRVRASDDTVERLGAHPLVDLLYRPTPRHSWSDVVLASTGYLQTTGNAYLHGVRPAFGSRKGKVNELWPMPPTVEVRGGGWVQPVTGYRLPKGNGEFQTWSPKEMLHLKYWNPDDQRYGLSPVQAGARSLTAAVAGLEARVRQYQNQGPPGILFNKDTGEPWTEAQLGGFRNYLARFFGSGRDRGRLPVVGGDLGFLNMGLSPVDLDVLAAIPHDKDAVCDLFRFPGQLLNGAKGSTFNNVSEARRSLYTACVLPLLDLLRDGLNRYLGADYDDGVYLDYDVSGIPELQANKQEMASWLATAWWVSTQDRQRMMGVAVDESLPKYLIPAGLVPADQLNALPPDGEV